MSETVLSAPIVARGWIAQLEEHRPYKARVGGSSPSPPTNVWRRTAGAVVQLVRIPACHAGGRGFESRPLRHFLSAFRRQRRPPLFDAARADDTRLGCYSSSIANSFWSMSPKSDASRDPVGKKLQLKPSAFLAISCQVNQVFRAC